MAIIVFALKSLSADSIAKTRAAVWEKRFFDGAWKYAPAGIPVREPATGIELGVAGAGTVELAVELTERAAAAVQTGPVDRGMRVARKLKAGMVHINDQTIGDYPGIPMGGMGQPGNGTRAYATATLTRAPDSSAYT